METRELGPLKVSAVGLGCNNFGRRIDEKQTVAVVQTALDEGITLFDTADVYGQGRSEELLGKGLGSRRDEVVIATKFGMPIGEDPARKGASPRWVEQAVEDSLRRLGTDRIDLYQLHAPDPDTPIEDTLAALDELVRAGKVKAIGNSNFSGEQIDEAAAVASQREVTPFVSAQNEYSVLRRRIEREVIPACERHGLAMLPYFPLASGMLTGKYRRGEDPPDGTRLAGMPAELAEKALSDRTFDKVEALIAFAHGQGRNLLELACSWLLAQPTIASVIAGATRPDQVQANVAAAGWTLTDDDLREVDRITG